jgi:hypothetical protein
LRTLFQELNQQTKMISQLFFTVMMIAVQKISALNIVNVPSGTVWNPCATYGIILDGNGIGPGSNVRVELWDNVDDEDVETAVLANAILVDDSNTVSVTIPCDYPKSRNAFLRVYYRDYNGVSGRIYIRNNEICSKTCTKPAPTPYTPTFIPTYTPTYIPTIIPTPTPGYVIYARPSAAFNDGEDKTAADASIKPAADASVKPAADASIKPAVDGCVKPTTDACVKPTTNTCVNPGPSAINHPGPGAIIHPGPGAIIHPGPGAVIHPGPVAIVYTSSYTSVETVTVVPTSTITRSKITSSVTSTSSATTAKYSFGSIVMALAIALSTLLL